MKKYFFDSIIKAILYLIFLSIVPLGSIGVQFFLTDKTLYISLFVAAFSMTYDYIGLFSGNVCKRIWWESVVATLCLIIVSVGAVIRLIIMIGNSSSVSCCWVDLVLIFILAIVMFINFWEFGCLLRYDYNKRYLLVPDTNKERLAKGAVRV